MTNEETQLIEKKWTVQELEHVKAVVAPGCDDADFALLVAEARALDLNPLLRQIWAVKYQKDKPAAIFAGYQGFLAIANRHPQFDGMEGPEITGAGDDRVATTKIYRKDRKYPFVAHARMKEFNKHQGNWNTMEEFMLGKTSIAMAIRMAFSITGVYSPEEGPFESGKEPKDITPRQPVIDADAEKDQQDKGPLMAPPFWKGKEIPPKKAGEKKK